MVVLGDLDALFHQRTPDLLRKTGVQPLDDGVVPTLLLDNPDGAFAAHDAYGNVKPADAEYPGRIAVPLDQNAVYLRATPGHAGGFAALLEALEDAELVGLEPLDLVVRDTTDPIDAGAAFGLTLANQHGHAVDVGLEVAVDGLTLDDPPTLRLEPRESRDLDVRVVAGQPAPSNLYPMRVRAAVRTASESGSPRDLGVAVHDETVRVNRVARQTVAVDGDLADWTDRWPQTIDAAEEALSLEEAMWTPFVPFEAGSKPGRATAFLAYDDEAFYFAARIADAKLVVTHDTGTRTVEAVIPWSAIPEVRDAMLAGEPVKFSYRVNHGEGNFNMELPRGRSAVLGLSRSFHPDWNQSWPNELSFGWDRPGPTKPRPARELTAPRLNPRRQAS